MQQHRLTGSILFRLTMLNLILALMFLGCDSESDPAGPEADTTAPEVSLSVSETLVLTETNLLLTVTATDNVGVTAVNFFDGATLLETITTSPYELSIALVEADNGVRTYRAEAADAAGNTDVSADHEVTVAINHNPVLVNGDFEFDASGWELHNFDEWSGWTDQAGNPPGCIRLNEFGAAQVDPGVDQLVSDLIPGLVYEITGEYRPYVAWIGNPAAESFVVTIDSVVVAAFPRGPNDEDWSSFTTTFSATDTGHTIGFWGEHVDDSSYELDNVALSVVP